ncbi:MAG TPA: septum formation initiator family protein [Luteolibacter sp.]|nr:septum formation initiator family protein [Luteolibacter sp.]
MARKRIEATRFARMEARTRAIQGAGRVALIALSLSMGFVVVATAFPQQRQLAQLEKKLEQAKQQQEKIFTERDCRAIELKALREDPEYLEIQARDRLSYSRPGERVLRFKQGQ